MGFSFFFFQMHCNESFLPEYSAFWISHSRSCPGLACGISGTGINLLGRQFIKFTVLLNWHSLLSAAWPRHFCESVLIEARWMPLSGEKLDALTKDVTEQPNYNLDPQGSNITYNCNSLMNRRRISRKHKLKWFTWQPIHVLQSISNYLVSLVALTSFGTYFISERFSSRISERYKS